jgi:hypothetical protein
MKTQLILIGLLIFIILTILINILIKNNENKSNKLRDIKNDKCITIRNTICSQEDNNDWVNKCCDNLTEVNGKCWPNCRTSQDKDTDFPSIDKIPCCQNYKGDNCSQKVCQHQGINTEDGNCKCVPIWSGDFCEIPNTINLTISVDGTVTVSETDSTSLRIFQAENGIGILDLTKLTEDVPVLIYDPKSKRFISQDAKTSQLGTLPCDTLSNIPSDQSGSLYNVLFTISQVLQNNKTYYLLFGHNVCLTQDNKLYAAINKDDTVCNNKTPVLLDISQEQPNSSLYNFKVIPKI